MADLERVWRGGQEQALLLMTGLKRRGHAAELVAVRESAIALRAQAAQVRVHTVGDLARQLGAARKLGRLVGQGGFDLVYANEAHALTGAWLARAHRRVPLVAARRVAFPLSRGLMALRRYRAASKIVAISQAVRRELLDAGLDGTRIQVVPDGVEIPGLVTPEIREKARARWNFQAGETVLICVGALTAEKGHALLIEAFGKLQREIPKCRLLIAGEGRLRAQLEEQTRTAGLQSAIVFAGFVPEIDAVYSAGDMFVFPSLQEGAGTSLLRAMAFGMPVLALARGGITEVVDDGGNAVLVREASAEALAAAAMRLLRDEGLRARVSRAARETIASRYSADRMVDDSAHIFEELISGRTAGPESAP